MKPKTNWKAKELFDKAGFSQAAIAAEAGIDPTKLSMIVRGWRKPTAHDIEALGRILGREQVAKVLGA